jgi:hypothetical protein
VEKIQMNGYKISMEDIRKSNYYDFNVGENIITIYGELVEKIGLISAYLLAYFLRQREYLTFNKDKRLREDGFFYDSLEHIKETSGLSEEEIQKGFDYLKKNTFIIVKPVKLSPENYYKINETKLQMTLFSSIELTEEN